MTKPGLATRQAASLVLTRVIDDGRNLDGLLDSSGNPAIYRALSDADKALVRAILVTALRHRGEIEYALNKVLDRKPPKNARHLIHTLHVAACQIVFLDVPDSAAVDLAVTSLREDKRSTRFAGLANAILRRLAREKDELFANKSDDERALLNMPPWLAKRTRKAYGRDRLHGIARRHMLEPVLDISVKSDPEQWAKTLGGIHLSGNTIRVDTTGSIEDWPGFKEGEWWVQDAAASLPARLLNDCEGKLVLDLCAAPGGKTAQLASAGAVVTALDTSKSRLERLQQNMNRLQLDVTTVESDLFEWEPDHLFDAVLLDAPCSSTGTIRRHPDVQWTKTPEIIDTLANLQHDMIVKAAEFLKPGGTLVFSNCSMDRAEGEDVFARLNTDAAQLTPDPVLAEELPGLEYTITGQGTVRTLPCHLENIQPSPESTASAERFGGLDGFFAARFKKLAE